VLYPYTLLTFLYLTYTTYNSITTTAMDEVIKDLEARKGGEELRYRKTTKIFRVNKSTLRRRH